MSNFFLFIALKQGITHSTTHFLEIDFSIFETEAAIVPLETKGFSSEAANKIFMIDLQPDEFFVVHVFSENFRNFDGTVSLLVVFDDGDKSSVDRKTRTVEKVNEFRL